MVRAASAAVVAALALPGSAAADRVWLRTDPVQVRDYRMTIVAVGGPRVADFVEVVLARVAGDSRQTHTFFFDRRVRLGADRTLRRGRLRADLGRFGRLSLRLAGGARPRAAPRVRGCRPARHTSRRARLRGAFRLVADHGSYFGTVTRRRLRGTISRPAERGRCSGDLLAPADFALYGSQRERGAATRVSFQKRASGSVRAAFEYDERTPASHVIEFQAPRDSFTAAPDLSSATATAFGPFVQGSLSFTATQRYFNQRPRMATGPLTGDLVAAFDSVGARRFSGRATLVAR